MNRTKKCTGYIIEKCDADIVIISKYKMLVDEDYTAREDEN